MVEKSKSWWETLGGLLTGIAALIAQNVYIGVRYGAGTWPGLIAEKLMDEEIIRRARQAFCASGDYASQPISPARL